MKKKIVGFIIFILIIISIVYIAAIPKAPYEGITLKEFFDARKNPDTELVLSSMTLEEKVGQIFMGCFYNETPSAETIKKYNPGSVLLFSKTFEKNTRKSLDKKLNAISSASDYPPLVAVDEEGGIVTRVSGNKAFRKKPFEDPRSLFKKGGMNAVIADAHEKNALLSSLGIHLNLAPVCDISRNPDDFMYSRSLGKEAETTADYTAKVVKACLEDNIACALKHFPGYGNSADTHKGLAVDKRPFSTLKNNDFLPFEAGIKAGVPLILVSHNIVRAIDRNLPASMSPASHRILREDMGFDGIILTDDLSMGAISNYLPPGKSAVTALMAGNDMLCTGNYKVQYKAVLKAVNDGIISEDRIDQSVRRIIELKIDLGLIDPLDFNEFAINEAIQIEEE